MNVLQINSSARLLTDGQGSHSTRLAMELVEALAAQQSAVNVVVRDLARQPHPALDEEALAALFTPAEARTSEQAQRVALDDELIAQVQRADALVIAAPMYNFGVSSQLKNWIDAISRARVTFRYTEAGPEGLLKGKKVYVVLTRGGVYRDTPQDSQAPYLRTVLGFLGMTDVEFIYAEGLNMGPDGEAKALASARQQIHALWSAVPA